MLSIGVEMMLDHCLRSSQPPKSQGRSELRTIDVLKLDEAESPASGHWETKHHDFFI